ncbi:239_t:CDS:2 [Cetraspora pellucida]|uniref:239_t:CDS:1 n=1 Tax=Cetraspora pellucida TaxID=1433469 RepID=A0ACA9L8T2_9GLOM|nr:239_t:CDS:2 [Cetraspora pellucida]
MDLIEETSMDLVEETNTDPIGHFIDENWSIRKLILSFKLVPVPYTGTAISHSFLKCLDDWNVISKVAVITVLWYRKNFQVHV